MPIRRGPRKDLSGVRFGYLVVQKFVGYDDSSRLTWEAICDCGKKYLGPTTYFTSGDTKSCGCKTNEMLRKAHTKHGHRYPRSKTNNSWRAMIQRCTNPSDTHFHYYGGRGVKVCDEWRDFSNFLRDMGERPEGLTLERKDPNGDYCKGNCKWATNLEQRHNRSIKEVDQRGVSYNGEVHLISEWSRILNISRYTLSHRINKLGWSMEKAISTPIESSVNCRFKKKESYPNISDN